MTPSLVSPQNLVMYEERLQKFPSDDLLTICSVHYISSVFFIDSSKISLDRPYLIILQVSYTFFAFRSYLQRCIRFFVTIFKKYTRS